MRLIEKTDDYENWFNSIKDRLVKARIQVRVDRLIEGNAGDTAPVGEGVNELRLHFGAGWRVYYTERGHKLIILLAGGNKSTQSKDIQKAIALAQNL
jgi:putative addiction module killer protein